MNPARVLAVSALVAGVIVVALTAGLLSGSPDGGPGRRAAGARVITDPFAEALRYIPSGAPIVAVIPTDARAGPLRTALDALGTVPGFPGVLRRAGGLLQERTGLSPTTELARLAGAPAVVARLGTGPGDPVLAAWVVASAPALASVLRAHAVAGTLQPAGDVHSATLYSRPEGGGYAQRGRVLLAATALTTLRAALARRSLPAGRRGGLSPEAFTARAAGSRAASTRDVLQVALSGPGLRGLIAGRVRGAAALPWVAAVRGAALAVTVDESDVRLTVRVRTDEASLSGPDLPVAPGGQAPGPQGDAPILLGVRGLGQAVAFARSAAALAAPGPVAAYRQVKDLLAQVARVDIERDILATLTGTATITLPADASSVTVRAQTSDPARVGGVLARLAIAGRAAEAAGSLGLGPGTGGLSVTDGGNARYTITRDGTPVAVVALRDDVLVVSGDPSTDTDGVVDAPDSTPGGGAAPRGALVARVSAAALAGLLVDRLGLPEPARVPLEALGDTTLAVHAELGFLTLTADVSLAG